MTTVYDTPPPYNPYYQPVEPSAPTYEEVFNHNPPASNSGFYGNQVNSQSDLGHAMLKADIHNKTEWVVKAEVPKEARLNRIGRAIGGALLSFLPGVIDPNKEEQHLLAKSWRRLGELKYANYINLNIEKKSRKADLFFQSFIADHANTNMYDCFFQSLNHERTSKTLFYTGRLLFADERYNEAIDYFTEALENLKDFKGSSYRKNFFETTIRCARGASFERVGRHDLALFDYLDASNTDPRGNQTYGDTLERNYQILRFKPNKTLQEINACMEFDPYNPEFHISAARFYLEEGDFQNMNIHVKKALDLAQNRPQVYEQLGSLMYAIGKSFK